MEQIRLGIIIPSFNTKELTLGLLLSLLINYKDKINYHFIIVENGSNDGTKELLKQKISNNLQFVLIDNPTNLGFTKAINQGIKKCEELKKTHYCFLNTDITIKDTTIFDKMIDVLKLHNDFGCLIFDDAIIGKNRDQRMTWKDENVGITDEGMWYCVMIPHSTIDKIGILDERFFLHCSDSDYQIRIKESGLKVGFLKNNKSIIHTSFTSSRKLKNIHDIIQKDRELLQKKYSIPLNKDSQEMYSTTGIPRIEYYKPKEDPFLTVLTRCYKRPLFLQKCKQSLLSQTDPDYEQIFIIDNIGRGANYANKAFELCKREYIISGKYVLVLDDDDMIDNPNFIYEMKNIIKTHDFNAIIFKGQVGERILPYDYNFSKKEPKSCQIGSFCIITKKEIFDKFLIEFGSDKAIGDFNFINAAWNFDKTKIHWYNKIMCKTQKVSLFQPQI